ncbi:carboxyltransferase domain-containing protein, partial [Paraburkholderia sp. Ac-20347]|uniref:carboxyltransferase domain-containing protein n=1 Tax=Paraburkholderia sp. Ac-20347 TaxID=2703892 RepID=UPI00198087B6
AGKGEAGATLPPADVPALTHEWALAVLDGPHGAPDFLTPDDIAMLYEARWTVHYNSSRTGVRLIGPKPQWARTDGGEAGLHPSNIHDNAYAIGAVDFTGDMPVILGPDGPSLGGFVCPVTVIGDELWKLGQLRPGDTVRFVPAKENATHECVLHRSESTGESGVDVVYRRSGDRNLLIEYGPPVLDLKLRFRVHALMNWLAEHRLPGIVDLTPGIRSLQVHIDPDTLSLDALLDHLKHAETQLPAVDAMRVPNRIVHLPLSWDDPSTRVAIERYMQSVRPDAPWCPSNIEFIRRINGLNSIDDVKRILFDARYLVLGLGDVYLGAPVATPVDPRHRLVTTKYNPARTWTPENAVGIGGAYLCVYGMEGPGGYQFVGRTVQMWNRYRTTKEFEAGKPWLLRFFDEIRFYEVSESELAQWRSEFIAGRRSLHIEESVFDLGEYERFLRDEAASIAAFKATQQAAFEAERERWREAGQAEYVGEPGAEGGANAQSQTELDDDCRAIGADVSGSVWKLLVAQGDTVEEGQDVAILESMKMEVTVAAPASGMIEALACQEGDAVTAGQRLMAIRVNATTTDSTTTSPSGEEAACQ